MAKLPYTMEQNEPILLSVDDAGKKHRISIHVFVVGIEATGKVDQAGNPEYNLQIQFAVTNMPSKP